MNIKDEHGKTALHWCPIMNHPEIARILIDAGADVNAKEKDEWSLLHYSAKFHSGICKLLIDAGADLNIQRNDGWTALHICAFSDELEVAKMLIEAGADKTIQDYYGNIPYELAQTKELEELLKV